MRAFEYAIPSTGKEVLQLLGTTEGEIEVLAGGTDLISLMKDDVARPKRLVDIKHVEEWKGIRAVPKSGFQIGALTTIQQLMDDANIRKSYGALYDAAEMIRSPQVRHRATLGGNLCQRPRCWYFRSGFGLYPKSPDGKSLVLEGDNRYHAILGNAGPAYYVHPSTLAPAFIAYGSKVRVLGAKGEREFPMEQLYQIPKSENEREIVLKPNEIVTAILLPPSDDVRGATYEVKQREGLDWPLVSATVVLKMKGPRIESARVALAHVAPVPWVAQEAEQALKGQSFSEELAAKAGAAAVQNAKSLSMNGYKIQLARVAVKRALMKAAGGHV